MPRQSVPEVDPAANMNRSQSHQRMSSGSYSGSPSPTAYSGPQAPALNVAGPIIANAEQVFCEQGWGPAQSLSGAGSEL